MTPSTAAARPAGMNSRASSAQASARAVRLYVIVSSILSGRRRFSHPPRRSSGTAVEGAVDGDDQFVDRDRSVAVQIAHGAGAQRQVAERDVHERDELVDADFAAAIAV